MSTASQPQARAPTIARRIGLVVLIVAMVLGPLIVRAWIDGRDQLQLAEAAAQSGDLDAQILHLGRAARWRLPMAEHDELARDQLRELAVTATEANDHTDALAAWRELRSALLGTRAVRVVDQDQLEAANAAIVQLMVRQADAAGVTVDPVQRKRWADELDQDLAPRGRSLLAAACFAAWLFTCVGLFVFGIDPKGRLDPRPALRWGGATLVLLISWILLM